MTSEFVKRQRRLQREVWSDKAEFIPTKGEKPLYVIGKMHCTIVGSDGIAWTWTVDPKSGKQSRARRAS